MILLTSPYRKLAAALTLIRVLPSVHSAAVSSSTAQTFLGIGGSGAWWPLDLYNFPDNVRQNLSSLLFSQDGLGLSSYRWNLGGGGVGVSNPTRAPETPYVSPGVYNFSKDPESVFFLQEAQRFGVESLTMFVNSAPAPLTSNKASCAGTFVNGSGAAYATYLVDVVSHWRNEGINISYISPMNEPDDSFGPEPCGQEGMEVSANQRAEVISSLWDALDSRGLSATVGILADESSSLSLATSEYPVWLPDVVDKVAYIDHHTYDFPSDGSYASYVESLQSKFPGKVTWMSEICCSLGQPNGTGRGYSGGYDPTITNALMFSGMVFQSLVLANEPHYDFWTLLSKEIGCSPFDEPSCATTPNSNGWTDGMIYYDPDFATNGNFELYIVKHFWTYKHFGNFVKPGSVRHIIAGSDASEFTLAVSDPESYYIIAMNPNTTDSTLSLTFPESICASEGFRTSAGEDFVSVSAATTKDSGKTWALPLHEMSLTTYVFRRGAC